MKQFEVERLRDKFRDHAAALERYEHVAAALECGQASPEVRLTVKGITKSFAVPLGSLLNLLRADLDVAVQAVQAAGGTIENAPPRPHPQESTA